MAEMLIIIKEERLMKIVNLTDHDVNVYDNETLIKTYRPSGLNARVSYSWDQIDCVDGIPIEVESNTKVVELPEPIEDVMFIVSTYVFNSCPDRTDLLVPAHQIKINGRVVGCMSFLTRR